MSDPPYAQEFLLIRDKVLEGLVRKIEQEKNHWTDVANEIAELRSLGARRNVLWARRLQDYESFGYGKMLKENLAKAADRSARGHAAGYVRPFALKACRLVLHALENNRIHQVPGLWGELVALGRSPRSDDAAIRFWRNSVVRLLKDAYPKCFRAVAENPWKDVHDCADAGAVLATLIAKEQVQWSKWLSLKIIAEIIGGEAKMRSVEKVLERIHSEIQVGSRGQYRVRLDTMDESYRLKFMAEPD